MLCGIHFFFYNIKITFIDRITKKAYTYEKVTLVDHVLVGCHNVNNAIYFITKRCSSSGWAADWSYVSNFTPKNVNMKSTRKLSRKYIEYILSTMYYN